MNSKYNLCYQNSSDIIKDLKKIMPKTDHQIIDQLEYCIGVINDASLKESVVKNFSSMKSIVDKELQCILKEFFYKNNDHLKAEIKYDASEITFFTLEKVISMMPELTELLECIGVKDQIVIDVNNNGLSIKCYYHDSDTSLKNRVRIYAVIRKLMLKKVIFTYSVNHSMDLFFDYSNDEKMCYLFELNDGLKSKMLFSNIINNYRILPDEIYHLAKSYTIEVNDFLKVKTYPNLPDHYVKRLPNLGDEKDFFYFNFLFRPILLILPSRGNLVDLRDVNMGIIDIDRESYSFFQDYCGSDIAYRFDLFNIIL